MGPFGQARPSFLEPSEGAEGGVDTGADEEVEEAAGAEDDCASVVGAGLGAAEVVGAAGEVATTELLKLVVGRGLQRLVELPWRFLLLKRERRAITS